ncbi:hypothetical protein [Propionivibrio soli]|uniref:hypothetical protein n=1 Tax=Propionivibrio soli TaxID=2976531 RepID=UPI0021E7CBDD|nr:hypothetical protein [Propionivibrio soli]
MPTSSKSYSEAMETSLNSLLEDLKRFRKVLKAETVPQVGKKILRNKANELGSAWHRDFSPKLKSAVPDEVCARYDEGFTRLIKLSSPNNLRSSYLDALNDLISKFRDELVIPAKQGLLATASPSAFDSFFASLAGTEESGYLQEAVACARAAHFRAAAVLGWSAAIDRIHRKLEGLGFQQFNVSSARMAGQQSGRYKKFNQVQNVNSIGEIREVFDTIVLWVIEGMGLIDSNQHTRLRSCFDMRCQSAHPGEAPITSFNLLSFFSDLDQIIFSNPKFKL